MNFEFVSMYFDTYQVNLADCSPTCAHVHQSSFNGTSQTIQMQRHRQNQNLTGKMNVFTSIRVRRISNNWG